MVGFVNNAVSLVSSESAREYAAIVVVALAWLEALTSIGAATGSLPTFFKHAVNLPLNAARIREMRRLVASVRQAQTSELNIEWLKPFMHPRRAKSGETLFLKGDVANEAYVLVEGRVEIVERSAALSPGEIFGEMALFTETGKRTATARCASDSHLLVITYEQFEQLYFQNPEFELYLVRLIVRRYEMNSAVPPG
jgi:hypothetical protein